MIVKAIHTRVLKPPKDDLYSVISESVVKIPEKSILVVTSKVVATHQGRCILRSEVADKNKLIREEADKYLPRVHHPVRRVMLTMKDNILIPAAGVDVSNGNGYYILWPDDPQSAAEDIYIFLKNKFSLKQFGVVIVDSRTIPLRWGTVGISLAHYGFCPLIDYRESRDLFGRKSLKLVFANVVDSIAAAAVLEMGEGGEQTPLALVTDVPFTKFGKCREGVPDLEVDHDEDLYAPLLRGVKWKRGGSSK